MTTRVLTGITTSGTPHLGNYAGAIRPSVQAALLPDVDAFYFLADYHALIKCDDPQRVARSRLEIAATWLAAGLNPEKVTFYRQSDIPEIPELCWMLTCVTAKGLMNRAHAYKAAVDQNVAREVEPDDGVTMGLFSYPVLMAADILMFNAHKVPVGRDQVQHLEMTRDIASRFNHLYGKGREFFVLPEAQVDDEVATLPGLDGRKMSKSYDNTIPLFEGGSKALKSAIARIVTDSRQPGEPKDAEGSHLYTLYRAFATQQEAAQFRNELEEGLGWGDAKNRLYERLERDLAPMRDVYAGLMANPARIEEILQAGAEKARRMSQPLMQELRQAVGLRTSVAVGGTQAAGQEKANTKKPRFVSFRNEHGQFCFRFLDAAGQQLFLSEAFQNPKDAGVVMKELPLADLSTLVKVDGEQAGIYLNEMLVARFPASSVQAVEEALKQLNS
jgi:tryptophanyl-tRNA synthetase